MHKQRRTTLLALAGAALAAALAGCATFAGPRDVDIPLAKLQRNVEKHFPIRRRALAVFELRVEEPRLATGNNDRLAMTANVFFSSPLLRDEFRGRLTLSGRLNVDATRNAVMLSDAQVEDFTIGEADERIGREARAAVRLLVEGLLHETPIYTWRPDELRYAGVQYVPTAIRTSSAGLSIHLEPLRERL